MRVFVYWNLNKGGFSLRALDGAAKGKVVAHASSVLLFDVKMTVGHASRLKIAAGAHKEVHAGFKGTLHAFQGTLTDQGERAGIDAPWRCDADAFTAIETLWEPITYNPKRDAGFVSRLDGRLIEGAEAIHGRTRGDGKADCRAVLSESFSAAHLTPGWKG